jgi:polyvinyl alcohol dehydrogenase (cytochrome)
MLLWKSPAPGKIGRVTGSLSYYDGRLYVPFTGSETLSGSNPDYECCKSRGSVVALDAQTGQLLWRSETIAEALTRIGTNERGTALWGPSGASVWNTPTIDPKRGLLYVGTGNSFGPSAALTSDSIIAFRLATGELVWHHQEFAGDSFMLGCKAVNTPGGNCPAKLGPDWDFGGSSVILSKLPDGRDILLTAGKGGVALGLDPDSNGQVLWRTLLFDGSPPTADGLVIFGGAADQRRVYYPLQRPGGGLTALDIASGRKLWTAVLKTDPRGQVGPASAITGVVFTGGWDGVLRAVRTDGRQIWSFQTNLPFATVNGIEAHGGSIGSAGVTVADGRLFVTSGYVGMQGGTAGNVLLAFGL